jgi:hypothetical protein
VTALRAFLYADWRASVHGFMRGVRSPGRIAVWTVYVGLLGFLVWSRVFFTRGYLRSSVGNIDVIRADFFICALLAAIAYSLAGGRGAIGIFRSRAEARFIIAAPVPAPLAITYLQAREALALGVRLLFSFMYFILLFGPRRVGPVTILADLVLLLALASAAAAVVVPRRLAPRPIGIACTFVGVPLGLLALAPVLRDAVLNAPVPLPAAVVDRVASVVPAWHPGHVLLEPNAGWLLAVLAVAGLAIAVLASAGRDAYPELYALSIARIDRLERWRRPRRASASPVIMRGRSPALVPAPAGVLVFVWKSGIEFARQTRPAYVVGAALLWCLAGFAAARFVALGEAALFATLVGVATNVLLVVGIGATDAIAGEVRRPLFWLAQAGLFERLCALALARIWRTIATLELVAVSFALGGGKLGDTLVVAIGLPALVTLLAGVAFAAFALFPSTADRHGPVAALRLVVSVLLLIPPFVLAIVSAVAFDAAPVGLGAAALLALIEAGALIGVAAWRLDGRIDRLPA